MSMLGTLPELQPKGSGSNSKFVIVEGWLLEWLVGPPLCLAYLLWRRGRTTGFDQNEPAHSFRESVSLKSFVCEGAQNASKRPRHGCS